MKILPLAIRASTGKPVFEPAEAEEFTSSYFQGYQNVRTKTVARITNMSLLDDYFDNPKESGWAIIIHPTDEKLLTELKPELDQLAQLRTNDRKTKCFKYDCKDNTPDSWATWLEEKYEKYRTPRGRPPYYLLIIGNPQKIPFGFQCMLHTVAAVGRIFFENLQEYKAYFDKVISAENGKFNQKPSLSIFAPNHDDATQMTAEQFAESLVAWKPEYKPVYSINHTIDRKDEPNKKATKELCLNQLSKESLGLFFFFGHGVFDDRNDPTLNNGALYCPQKNNSNLDIKRDTISATDIKPDGSYLRNGILYQYSCFGYGTPAISTIDHWLYERGGNRISKNDSLSALPKKLLSLKYGPLAYIGHMDAALVFEGTKKTAPASDQLEPIQWAIESFLNLNRTIGYSLQQLRDNHLRLNDIAVMQLNSNRQKGMLEYILSLGHKERVEFIVTMLHLIDVKNFMILGDPAVRLPIFKRN
jgi:hypothetical protein